MESKDNRLTTASGQVVAGSDIELTDVCYSLHGREILQQVLFTSHGTRLGVVGRNGSGKSTLARLLAGIIAPDSGRVRINGLDPARKRRLALREVGILFQNPDHQIIFPTVVEEIAFGVIQQGHTKSEATDIAKDILQKFQVPHWEEVDIHHLSQGQKHLVCIMAVMAMQPRILILDEPFAGFDIPTRAQLGRYLDRYEGCLVHITHRPEELTGYQQVVWLDSGRVRAIGPVEEVLPAYVTQMTALGKSLDITDLTR